MSGRPLPVTQVGPRATRGTERWPQERGRREVGSQYCLRRSGGARVNSVHDQGGQWSRGTRLGEVADWKAATGNFGGVGISRARHHLINRQRGVQRRSARLLAHSSPFREGWPRWRSGKNRLRRVALNEPQIVEVLHDSRFVQDTVRNLGSTENYPPHDGRRGGRAPNEQSGKIRMGVLLR